MKTLKRGSKGEDVKFLQSLLFLKQDGIFGPLTEEGVKHFQEEHNLVVDGIVGEKTWSALTRSDVNTDIVKSVRPIKEIVLHCAATQEGKDFTVADIKRWHLGRGFSDIGYHYVIYRDGSVNIGRNININGAHVSGYNSNTIGICYIGGVDKNGKAKDTRTPQQKDALFNLVEELLKIYNLTPDKVKGHYEYPKVAKACPSFDMDVFRKELKDRLQ